MPSRRPFESRIAEAYAAKGVRSFAPNTWLVRWVATIDSNPTNCQAATTLVRSNWGLVAGKTQTYFSVGLLGSPVRSGSESVVFTISCDRMERLFQNNESQTIKNAERLNGWLGLSDAPRVAPWTDTKKRRCRDECRQIGAAVRGGGVAALVRDRRRLASLAECPRASRDGSGPALGVIGLGAYGFVATFQSDSQFGRVLAAYGGVFVAGVAGLGHGAGRVSTRPVGHHRRGGMPGRSRRDHVRARGGR